MTPALSSPPPPTVMGEPFPPFPALTPEEVRFARSKIAAKQEKYRKFEIDILLQFDTVNFVEMTRHAHFNGFTRLSVPLPPGVKIQNAVSHFLGRMNGPRGGYQQWIVSGVNNLVCFEHWYVVSKKHNAISSERLISMHVKRVKKHLSVEMANIAIEYLFGLFPRKFLHSGNVEFVNRISDQDDDEK